MIHFTDGGGTLAFFYCVVWCMLRSEQFPGFGHAASQLGFGGGRKVVCSCVCVFERVLSTVCGAIRSQCDVFLRVFERGFGNGLRGNRASEGTQNGVSLRVLEWVSWNGLRGNWASEAVAKWCVSCVYSSGFRERSAG